MPIGELAPAAVFRSQPAVGPPCDEASDRQLLKQFVRRHDQSAFAALLRRHGPMVLGVCRRVLHHEQDAEDAFQATFLVLAKRAHGLGRPERLANWLYGVAYRTAQHAQARAARRCQHEREAASMAAAKNEPEAFDQELCRLLEEELHRLPEKYRAPLVLCYLEGKTNEEAARLLGWPVGSMYFRLARGRELLRERLTGRLRELPAALPPAFLAQQFKPAVVPPFLADATVLAALGMVGTKLLLTDLVSGSVRELMEATLRSLASSRRWFLGAILAALTLLGLSVGAYAASAGWSPAGHSPPVPHCSGAGGGCSAH
jgi:RNA polymerase sigma factor (sigma-70 family)